ncbi:hypothetical protein Leryth_016350 [Lithospermum erythrorhizon]|nr:hypothetical protein Leryth_016350 [Lithospermum erythrorhizon]
MMNNQHGHDQNQSKMFYELSSLVLNLIRSPPSSIDFSDEVVAEEEVGRRRRGQQMTPGGFVYLMLGISLTLMLSGWITFFIGFLLMPWVLGLVLIFYVVGVVSSLSMLARAVFCCTSPSPKDDCSSWKLL